MKRTMMCIGCAAVLLALSLAQAQAAAPSNVVINEVMWDGGYYYGTGGTVLGEYGEYIELYNPTRNAVTIDGWEIIVYKKGGAVIESQFTLDSDSYSLTIPAFGHYLIVDDSYFVASGGYNYLEPFDLLNDGGKIELRNSAGALVDTAGTGQAWPAGVNTDTGRSMERLDPAASGAVATNWGHCWAACFKNGRYGTPGLRNSQTPYLTIGGVAVSEHAATVSSSDQYIATALNKCRDYGSGTFSFELELIPPSAPERSMFLAVDPPSSTSPAWGEIVYSPFSEETQAAGFTENFLVKVKQGTWVGYAYLDVTNAQFSGSSEGEAAAGYVLAKACPWDDIIKGILDVEKWWPTIKQTDKRGFGEMQQKMYDMRDRMTPAMRAKATSCSRVFLHILGKYPDIKNRMLPLVDNTLILIDNPDMRIPQEMRDEIASVSTAVESAMKAQRIDAPVMTTLVTQVRAIAADAKVATVNQMLKKYGDPVASR